MTRKSGNAGSNIVGLFALQPKEIHDRILCCAGQDLRTLGIRRQARIQSRVVRQKNGTPLVHEVDMYREFEAVGIRHKVCVQLKDYEITPGMVLGFEGILDDIGGQSHGIIGTSLGFLPGTEATAERHGIMLYSFPSLPVEIKEVRQDTSRKCARRLDVVEMRTGKREIVPVI